MADTISLKEVTLTKENVLTIFIYYLQKCQSKGVYTKMGDSSSIFRAIQVFKGEETEITKKQAAQIMTNGILAGQATGMYTFEESHLLHTKFIPYLHELTNEESEPQEKAEKVV
jgi:hypothetical protein